MYYIEIKLLRPYKIDKSSKNWFDFSSVEPTKASQKCEAFLLLNYCLTQNWDQEQKGIRSIIVITKD